jgi:[CysO sulfur-carrier protein]-S-L-cysteine hydrolase
MKIEFPHSERARMKRLLRRTTTEVGGLLMGEQIEPGNFKIVDFSVDRDSGGVAHFIRNPKHHKPALDQFFEKNGFNYARFNYLGEWHSHPPHVSAYPSHDDVKSMRSIIESELFIDFAFLLVVRLKWRLVFEFSVTEFQRGRPPRLIGRN